MAAAIKLAHQGSITNLQNILSSLFLLLMCLYGLVWDSRNLPHLY